MSHSLYGIAKKLTELVALERPAQRAGQRKVRVSSSTALRRPPSGVSADPSPRAANREVVLIVDDEPWIRLTTRRMLEHLGYLVIEAPDGPAGLEVFRQRAAEITSVLLDLSMPEMDGQDVLKELRRQKPELHVILSSGFTKPEQELDAELAGQTPFLEKPYTVDELARALTQRAS